MGHIKVIILDVDGTLLNHQKKIMDKTRDALLAIQKKQIRIMLVSGRPLCGLTGYAKELNMRRYNGMLASCNGHQILNLKSGEILFERTIPKAVVHKVLRHCKTYDVTVMIDDGIHLFIEDSEGFMVDYEAKGNNFIIKKVDDLVKFIDFDVHKILISGESEYLMNMYEALYSPFYNDLDCMFTSPCYMEYVMKDFDRVAAIQTVLETSGYHRNDIMAFGDGSHDIDLLQYAGIGIAMENGDDDVKEVADFITLSNEEDGISYALERLL